MILENLNMDIQGFLTSFSKNSTRTTLTLLYLEFISEKNNQLVAQNKEARTPYNTLPYFLRNYIPETEVIVSTGEKVDVLEKGVNLWRYLILPNVAFQSHGDKSYRSVSICEENGWLGINSVNYLIAVNAQMPQWKAEFKELCSQYSSELQNIEQKRLEEVAQHFPSAFISTYLQDKANDLLLLNRRTPDYAERLLHRVVDASGKPFDWEKKDFNVQYKLPNMQLMIQKGNYWPFLQATGFSNGGTLNFRDRDISLETLQELDRQLPIWMEEAKTILFDLQKKEKAEQIGRNVMRALVKQKMRELKMEYQIEEDCDKGNLVLALKLEKRRMLKLTLRFGNIDSMKRQLDSVAEIVNALNNVPMNYRIYFQNDNMRWQKEEEE